MSYSKSIRGLNKLLHPRRAKSGESAPEANSGPAPRADAPAPSNARASAPGLGAAQKLRAINCNVFAIPKLYIPVDPSLSPSELFPDGKTLPPKHCTTGNCSNSQVDNQQYDRYVCTADPHAILIYAAGSMIEKDTRGRMVPSGGYGHVYHSARNVAEGEDQEPEQRFIAMTLELEGPDEVEHEYTLHRAELRAALAVLQIHDWDSNNIQRLVIATSSEYVVQKATQELGKALINDFHFSSDGRDINPKDLWAEFWNECEYWHEHGVEIFFWQITEEQNQEARKHADDGANKPNTSAFVPLRSLMI